MFRVPPRAWPLSLVDGDSNSSNIESIGWVTAIQALPGPASASWLNQSVGGRTAAQIDSAFSTNFGGYSGLGAPKLFFCMAGTNDLNASVSAATIIASLQSIWTKAVAIGALVTPITILPAENRAVDSQWNLDRLAINVTIRASGFNVYDAASDFSDPNSSYFKPNGGGHLNDLGSTTFAANLRTLHRRYAW